MSFEAGVVIFFRILAPDNTLARSVHPTARHVVLENEFSHPEDYLVTDANGDLLGIYPRDWVAAILPLETVGPANVTNQPPRRDSAATAAEGDTEGQPRRTKRFNPS